MSIPAEAPLCGDEMILPGDRIRFPMSGKPGTADLALVPGKMTAAEFRKYCREENIEIYREKKGV